MTTKFNTLGIKNLSNLNDISSSSILSSNISATNVSTTNITSTNNNSTNLYFIGAQGVQGSIGFLTTNQLYASNLDTQDLNVSATLIVNELQLNGNVSQTGSGNIDFNEITSTRIYGEIMTPTQPYITSVGTLDYLTVDTGITCDTLSGTITTSSQPNITSLGTLPYIQGTQSSFNFVGFQTLQGQQAYISSSLNCKDIYTTGIQGTQSSFRYVGTQTVQTSNLQASNRIGIGTTNPSYQLDVIGTSSSTNFARFNNYVPSATFVSWNQPEGISLYRHKDGESYLRFVSGVQQLSAIEFNTTSIRDGMIMYKHDVPSTNRYMTFTTNQVDRCRMDATGLLSYSGVQGLQGHFNTSLYSRNIFGTGFQGLQSSFNFMGCQTIQGQQAYISSSLQSKDIYTVGIQGVQSSFKHMGCQSIQGDQGFILDIQGVQSSFKFMGCQTLQGQQGYISSSLQAKDIYTVGIQGLQSFFSYSGVQALSCTDSMVVNNVDVGTANNPSSTITYELSVNNTLNTSIKKFGKGSIDFSPTSTSLVIKGITSGNFPTLYAQFSTAYTIEFWIYPISFSLSKTYLFSSYDEGYFDFSVSTLGGSNYVWFKLTNTFSVVLESFIEVPSMTVNAWTHIAIMFNNGLSTDKYRLFVNGAFLAIGGGTSNTVDIAKIFHPTQGFCIGARYNGGTKDNRFNGYIDEFRISATNVYGNSGFTPPTSQLTSDANTVLLNRMESMYLYNSQITPTLTRSEEHTLNSSH